MTRINKRRLSAGFSLIELLVSMAIGLILTLAITSVMTNSETVKRSTTRMNDVNQTGAYVAYELDRTIRSAGSGFMQSWSGVNGGSLGCLLNASQNGSVLLPHLTAFPAPFDGVSANVRLMPVLITRGTDSDVLTVMSGSSGFAEVGRRVLPASVTADSVRLLNTLGWRTNDLLLLVQNGATGCMVQQVRNTFITGADQELPFGGAYFNATGTNVSLSAMGSGTDDPFAIALGNIDNMPLFQLIGVNAADHTLVSHDLLAPRAGDAAVPIAEGVVALRAVYGLDSNGDGVLDAWADPTGNFSAAALSDGSATAQTRLRQIVAVRVGLFLRTNLIEQVKNDSAGNPIPIPQPPMSLFDGVAGVTPMTRTLAGDELQTRHRQIEFTTPLRNTLLLP
jgi:type IV pilus assembly protein PilW